MMLLPSRVYRSTPAFWLRMFVADTAKPLRAVVLGLPEEPIAGVQPNELTLAVQ